MLCIPFSEISLGTDDTEIKYYIKQKLNHALESFKIANKFLDVLGKIDVVSEANIIKKLLKMPYSKSCVSVIIHKIEDTILLEDFDFTENLRIWEKLKLLLECDSVSNKSEIIMWAIFHHYIYHNLMNSKDKSQSDTNDLDFRNLMAKFLYFKFLAKKGEFPKSLQNLSNIQENSNTFNFWDNQDSLIKFIETMHLANHSSNNDAEYYFSFENLLTRELGLDLSNLLSNNIINRGKPTKTIKDLTYKTPLSIPWPNYEDESKDADYYNDKIMLKKNMDIQPQHDKMLFTHKISDEKDLESYKFESKASEMTALPNDLHLKTLLKENANEMKDTSQNSTFNYDENFWDLPRNYLWNFEDLRMLVRSDLPIFGGGKYPAITLRLKDMNQPGINVLTGLDYWLDNLMCNVPELVMCYHLDGMVKRYEMFKTGEIPELPFCSASPNNQPGSGIESEVPTTFNPDLIRDLARNLLSFVKSKCAKQGHTYWLFKGAGDEVVKLYDLTSLITEFNVSSRDPDHCQARESADQIIQHAATNSIRQQPFNIKNPYTLPVAFLLYRLARPDSEADSRIALLTKCRRLLKNSTKALNNSRDDIPLIVKRKRRKAERRYEKLARQDFNAFTPDSSTVCGENWTRLFVSASLALSEAYIPANSDPFDHDEYSTSQSSPSTLLLCESNKKNRNKKEECVSRPTITKEVIGHESNEGIATRESARVSLTKLMQPRRLRGKKICPNGLVLEDKPLLSQFPLPPSDVIGKRCEAALTCVLEALTCLVNEQNNLQLTKSSLVSQALLLEKLFLLYVTMANIAMDNFNFYSSIQYLQLCAESYEILNSAVDHSLTSNQSSFFPVEPKMFLLPLYESIGDHMIRPDKEPHFTNNNLVVNHYFQNSLQLALDFLKRFALNYENFVERNFAMVERDELLEKFLSTFSEDTIRRDTNEPKSCITRMSITSRTLSTKISPVSYYEKALEIARDLERPTNVIHRISKKLANCLNELANSKINQCKTLVNHCAQLSDEHDVQETYDLIQSILANCENDYSRASTIFESLGDDQNSLLIACNMASLPLIHLAATELPQNRVVPKNWEGFYKKAIKLYESALRRIDVAIGGYSSDKFKIDRHWFLDLRDQSRNALSRTSADLANHILLSSPNSAHALDSAIYHLEYALRVSEGHDARVRYEIGAAYFARAISKETRENNEFEYNGGASFRVAESEDSNRLIPSRKRRNASERLKKLPIYLANLHLDKAVSLYLQQGTCECIVSAFRVEIQRLSFFQHLAFDNDEQRDSPPKLNFDNKPSIVKNVNRVKSMKYLKIMISVFLHSILPILHTYLQSLRNSLKNFDINTKTYGLDRDSLNSFLSILRSLYSVSVNPIIVKDLSRASNSTDRNSKEGDKLLALKNSLDKCINNTFRIDVDCIDERIITDVIVLKSEIARSLDLISLLNIIENIY
ncbi:uncharacterized protein LOC135927739 isoform X2 [Gordionus sp. m RMFG-2023]|uniref:uncharacterized protein LOC135927739 isoform X2 n=1 Tax=Gordionus sp. m RMFG-2023 TaxID=3053472 RepID=UPI0031FC6814